MSSHYAVGWFDPKADNLSQQQQGKPDLDNEAAIDTMVIKFYYKLLNDDLMAPLFYDVANIDVGEHIPKIAQYWYKMLLGDTRYKRHTMQVHRDVHKQEPLRGAHHERWLYYFMQTIDADFAGPKAAAAKRLALRFSDNLYRHADDINRLQAEQAEKATACPMARIA